MTDPCAPYAVIRVYFPAGVGVEGGVTRIVDGFLEVGDAHGGYPLLVP